MTKNRQFGQHKFFGLNSRSIRPQHRMYRRLESSDPLFNLRRMWAEAVDAQNMRPESLPFDTEGLGRREAVPVSEVGGFPYGAICKVWSSSVEGTGFLVSGNRIVTAAHVIARALSRRVQFPGQQPFQVQRPQMWINPNFRVDGDAYDYGIISVHPQAVLGIAALPMVGATIDVLRRSICEIAGYPVEFTSMLRYPKHQQNAGDPTAEIRLSNSLILHRFDTSIGQSGSPILARPINNPSQCIAIGVHTYGEGDREVGWLNRGVAFPVGIS